MVLEEWIVELRQVAAERLVSLIEFGSAVRSEPRRTGSDTNLLIVLDSANAEVLEKIGAVLRDGFRELRVEPMILERAEIQSVVDCFAQKMREIQRRHAVLAGDDVVAELKFDREHLRIAVEQGLRNALVRLRKKVALSVGDPLGLRAALLELLGPMTAELDAWLELRNQPVDALATRAQTVAAAVSALQGAGGGFEALLAFSVSGVGEPIEVAKSLMDSLAAAIALIDRPEA
ncbi:MAG: hypothetical protein HY791_38655 [Deltaproteobacteria bacterium]|nr:hypothetical protein [Deltaproteobacteria bacterium]